MYNNAMQYPMHPFIQPMYCFRYDNQVQGMCFYDNQNMPVNNYSLIHQQNILNSRESHLQSIITSQNGNIMGCNPFQQGNNMGNNSQSLPIIFQEKKRVKEEHFEQSKISGIEKNSKQKISLQDIGSESNADKPQIQEEKRLTVNTNQSNSTNASIFSEDYRIAGLRYIKKGYNKPIEIICNDQFLSKKNNGNLADDRNINYGNITIKPSHAAAANVQNTFLNEIHSSSSQKTFKASEKQCEENLKYHRNSNDTIKLECCTQMPQDKLKKIKNSKKIKLEEKYQSQHSQKLIIQSQFQNNKELSFLPIKQDNQLKKIKPQKINDNRVDQPVKTNFLNAESSQHSALEEHILDSLSIESTNNSDKSLKIVNEIKCYINQQNSIDSVLKDIQNNAKNFSQEEILSKCIFITQQSETHKVFQQILKQPFFLGSDSTNQCESNQPNNNSIKDQSAQQFNQQQTQNLKAFRTQNDQYLQKNTNPLQETLTSPKKQKSDTQINNQSNFNSKVNQNQKASNTNLILNSQSNQLINDRSTKILDFQESIKRKMIFQPRDLKMLNLYNFSVMRDFPERKSNNSQQNNQNCSVLETPVESDIQNDKMDVEQAETNQNENSQSQTKKNKNKKTIYSRFHNLNKLFIYNIMAMLQNENLENFNIPYHLRVELIQFLKRLKLSGKVRPCSDNPSQQETYNVESFSHVHYNVLFLKINESNISIIRKSPRDVFLHKLCFNVDLNNYLDIEIIKINILKKIIFQIFMQSIQEHLYVDDHSFSKSNNRVLYSIKAIKGIKKLSLGIYFNRF